MSVLIQAFLHHFLQNCDSRIREIANLDRIRSVALVTKDDSRTAIVEAIRQVLAGEPAPERLRNAIASPSRLGALEKSAWVQLQNWSADENLRRQFPKHAEFSRRRLTELLEQLEV